VWSVIGPAPKYLRLKSSARRADAYAQTIAANRRLFTRNRNPPSVEYHTNSSSGYLAAPIISRELHRTGPPAGV
jgi:hypothetical protein